MGHDGRCALYHCGMHEQVGDIRLVLLNGAAGQGSYLDDGPYYWLDTAAGKGSSALLHRNGMWTRGLRKRRASSSRGLRNRARRTHSPALRRRWRELIAAKGIWSMGASGESTGQWCWRTLYGSVGGIRGSCVIWRDPQNREGECSRGARRTRICYLIHIEMWDYSYRAAAVKPFRLFFFLFLLLSSGRSLGK